MTVLHQIIGNILKKMHSAVSAMQTYKLIYQIISDFVCLESVAWMIVFSILTFPSKEICFVFVSQYSLCLVCGINGMIGACCIESKQSSKAVYWAVKIFRMVMVSNSVGCQEVNQMRFWVLIDKFSEHLEMRWDLSTQPRQASLVVSVRPAVSVRPPQFVRRTDWCLLFTDGGVVVNSREICCGEGPSSVISQLEGEVWCMGETSHHHLVMEVLSLPDSPASTLRPPADCCSDIINTSHDTGQLHHVAAIST